VKALGYLRKGILFFLLVLHIGYLLLGVSRVIQIELWWVALLNTFALWVYLPLLFTVPLGLVLRGRATTVIGLLALLWAGVILFNAYGPIGKPEIPANAFRLNVITYNFLGWNRNAPTSVAWLVESGADILFLEEVAAPDGDPLFAQLEAVYPYSVDIPGDNRIMSKYELLETSTIRLAATRQMLRAVIAPQGQPISLYSIHVELPNQGRSNLPMFQTDQQPFNMMLSYNETVRNQMVLEALGVVRQEPHPFIIAGDWNLSSTSTMYSQVSERVIDAYRQGGGELFGMTWPVAELLSPSLRWLPSLIRIDYIFHSDDFATVSARRGEAIGSDHYPVVAELAYLGGG
jgi:endonuclease/exonuclease/phosphatase (EEP) superfamily protein YafD